jgi:hypothetical protein
MVVHEVTTPARHLRLLYRWRERIEESARGQAHPSTQINVLDANAGGHLPAGKERRRAR